MLSPSPQRLDAALRMRTFAMSHASDSMRPHAPKPSLPAALVGVEVVRPLSLVVSTSLWTYFPSMCLFGGAGREGGESWASPSCTAPSPGDISARGSVQ